MFDKHLFLENPLPCLECKRPFIVGTREKKWKATIAHRFVELLHEKTGKLTRLYTQNIDGLEGQCKNLPKNLTIPVHGSLDRIACEVCQTEMDNEKFYTLMQSNIKDITGMDVDAPKTSTPIPCEKCGLAAVKPTVVLFHSRLPKIFFESIIHDLPNADLLIVVGTSLMVSPANQLVAFVSDDCLRVVVNKEPVGSMLGIDYCDTASRDYFARGCCDETLLHLIDEMGWMDDISDLKDELPDGCQELLRDYCNE